MKKIIHRTPVEKSAYPVEKQQSSVDYIVDILHEIENNTEEMEDASG